MNYSTHASDIVGYQVEADFRCRDCMHGVASVHGAAHGLSTEGVGVEELMDRWARRVGIDRSDESSFDTREFPKVVLASHVEGPDRCGGCGEYLIEPV